MVVSLLNACNINNNNGVLNQPNLESSIHWRQSPQATSPETDQQNCILNFNNHDQRPSSPVQNGEENSCYSSENGADNLSPRQGASRSSSSEDLGVDLFPISGCNPTQQCFDYSNSDNESSQASPSSFHDDDPFRPGKESGNSGGKPKVHKCRSCGFSTSNKSEYWEHNAIHMKPEKILRCPECPFVTEYKHHLDFHIWNHQGMKPFKCDQCAYHCVNKSMLKSHLKSHSNVYQYRCQDCNYRTKYCHSLKIHLRKYKHSPGMVLDPDGNPNPNPVIDVYGNRRGPKQKSKKGHGHGGGGGGGGGGTDHAVMPLQQTMPPLNAFQNLNWNVFFPDNSRIPCPILPNPAIMSTPPPFMSEMPKHEITSHHESDNLNNNIKIAINNNNNHCSTPRSLNHTNNNNLFVANNNTSSLSVERIKRENVSDDEEMYHPDVCLEVTPTVSPQPPQPNFAYLPFEPAPAMEMMECGGVEEAPLNLSVSHTLAASQERLSTPAATAAKTNRRKGVACKLKRILVEEEAEDGAKDLTVGSAERALTPTNEGGSSGHENEAETDNQLLAKIKSKKDCFYCHFCEITFFNQIMFTMHMGYHGYLDPFTCNRCGKKTQDKIDFYAHMISAAH